MLLTHPYFKKGRKKQEQNENDSCKSNCDILRTSWFLQLKWYFQYLFRSEAEALFLGLHLWLPACHLPACLCVSSSKIKNCWPTQTLHNAQCLIHAHSATDIDYALSEGTACTGWWDGQEQFGQSCALWSLTACQASAFQTLACFALLLLASLLINDEEKQALQ